MYPTQNVQEDGVRRAVKTMFGRRNGVAARTGIPIIIELWIFSLKNGVWLCHGSYSFLAEKSLKMIGLAEDVYFPAESLWCGADDGILLLRGKRRLWRRHVCLKPKSLRFSRSMPKIYTSGVCSRSCVGRRTNRGKLFPNGSFRTSLEHTCQRREKKWVKN